MSAWIYDQDPKKHPDAKRYDKVTNLESLHKDLKVMDMTAFALCRDNKLPIMVFNMEQPGNIGRAIANRSEPVGTLVVSE